jgi:hypothetical protein
MKLTLAQEGTMQRRAGASLILDSHLLLWDENTQRFVATTEEAFEEFCRGRDPEFGRLMCWIEFSAGAEFFGKGVCLRNSIEIRKDKPDGTHDFGTLSNLLGRHFTNLFKARNATPAEKTIVREGYRVLQETIRNRDAHGYHQGVRRANFPLVESHFLGALNTLLDWYE